MPDAIESCPAAGAGSGVNIHGYFRGQFGLGEGARLYTRALLATGYPVALLDMDVDVPHGLDDASFERTLGDAMPYPVHLVFANPDYMDHALDRIRTAGMPDPRVIGCWFWELERIPEGWAKYAQRVDEVVVSSEFVATALREFSDKPVTCIPLPVGELRDSGLQREDFGLPSDAYLFLTSFDFNSSIDRKNPFAVIEAFQRAFEPAREDVALLVKSSNGHRYPERLLELSRRAGGDPRIIVRDDIIDRAHMRALQRCVDAYVSLHRAEGFGLGMAECMWLGKPVIGTAWSGNMQFMTPANACLVPFELVPVAAGQYQHGEGQRWAEPDVDAAAAYMRRLVDERQYASAIGERAAADIRHLLSADTVAERLIARFETHRPVDAGFTR